MSMSMTNVDVDENFKLPKDICPVNYELYLHPNIQQDTFSGTVDIIIFVHAERKTIALHQKNLNITSAKLMTHSLQDNYEIKISSIGNPTEYDIFEISTESVLSGTYKLSLDFNGSLKDNYGFYSTYYKFFCNDTYEEIYTKTPKHKRTDIRYYASTKFESHYARRAFPCFDEPGFKTIFRIKLVIPSTDRYNAISNMPIMYKEIDKPKKGLTTIDFEQSLLMSTYQARFIISDFESTKEVVILPKNTCLISVYTTRAQSEEKRYFALDIGMKAFKYYIETFRGSYKLPIFDMIAIPDLSSSTKSWEVAIFKEAELLYDEHNDSITKKREIVLNICHKLAYSFFEQYVTLRSWDDSWFNEGLATFFSYQCANNILPNQEYMEQFLVDIMHRALVIDAELNSHSMIHNVENPKEISSFFDEISCKKGASLICMMKNFLGSEVFYKNIKFFLDEEDTEIANYIRFLDKMHHQIKEIKVNVKDTMDTWMRQEGYPVINVKKLFANKFVLTQKRFLSDPDTKHDASNLDGVQNLLADLFNLAEADEVDYNVLLNFMLYLAQENQRTNLFENNVIPYRYRWTVPITYITNRNEIPTLVWFEKDATEVIIEVDEQTRWVKFNAGQVGYYRVNYGEEWNTFIDLLLCNPTRLSVSDRVNLLDDLFNLAEADEVDYNVLLNFMLYLAQEYRAFPWAVAFTKLKKMYIILSTVDKNIALRLQRYISKLVNIIYDDLTWTVDDAIEEDLLLTDVDGKMRAMILELACISDVSDCLKTASNLVKDFLLYEKKLHPDIREVVYRYGSHNFKEEDWSYMVQMHADEVDPIEKRKLLIGITSAQSSVWLKDFIIKAINDCFSDQYFLECLILMSENPAGGIWVVWDWVRDNWEYLVKRYTLNDERLSEFIPAITKFFATEIRLNEMKAFFEKYPEAGVGADNRVKALKTVSDNIRWVKSKGTTISKWYSLAVTKSMKWKMICDLNY